MVYSVLKDVLSEPLLRRMSSSFMRRRAFSSAVSTDKVHAFRTSESNPINHSKTESGQYYIIPEDVRQQLYRYGGITANYGLQIKTFNETAVMVRDPTLELLHYLKTADYSRPVNRYVIYGDQGCGKTISLVHTLHFGFVSEFILIHVPSVKTWMRNFKEVSNSLTREGYVDLNMDAAAWLVHFKSQNSLLLKKLDLRVSKKYEWSQREVTEEGSPLMDLVDLGVKRVKYASECVIAIANEIKKHSTEGRCKTLVVIDGYNAFFHPETGVVTERKVKVPPSKISLTEAFVELSKYDWCNGAVVVTVDKYAILEEDKRESFLPMYLLGKEGFEHLDPFVPIKMPDFSDKEIESCLDYYIERRWIQNKKACTEEGKQELKYLSGMNPLRLLKICAPL